MLLPTPIFYKGEVRGFIILAAWYSALHAPPWVIVAHAVVATAVACLWTRWLNSKGEHGSSSQRGLRWTFAYTTCCALFLSLLRFTGVSAHATVALMIPVVVYFVVPWLVHKGDST